MYCLGSFDEKAIVPRSEFGVTDAPVGTLKPTPSSASGAPEGARSFSRGSMSVASPAKTCMKSGVPTGFSVPAGFTSTVSVPVAVSRPSETVNATSLSPSSPDLWSKVT